MELNIICNPKYSMRVYARTTILTIKLNFGKDENNTTRNKKCKLNKINFTKCFFLVCIWENLLFKEISGFHCLTICFTFYLIFFFFWMNVKLIQKKNKRFCTTELLKYSKQKQFDDKNKKLLISLPTKLAYIPHILFLVALQGPWNLIVGSLLLGFLSRPHDPEIFVSGRPLTLWKGNLSCHCCTIQVRDQHAFSNSWLKLEFELVTCLRHTKNIRF